MTKRSLGPPSRVCPGRSPAAEPVLIEAETYSGRCRSTTYLRVMAAQNSRSKQVPQATSPAKRREVAAKPKSRRRAAEKPEVRIFVSYSHADAVSQTKLRTHLAPWRRDGVTLWYDENIEPGADLNIEIARELRRAHIFVALFSPAYLDSNYCWNIEYKRAMGRRARGGMRVVAVVVKPCAWKQTRAAGFKLLPKDGVPPERWSSSDAAFANVAEGIGEVIKAVRRELATMPPKPSRAASKPKATNSRPSSPKKVRATSSAKPRAAAQSPSKRKG